MKHALNLLSILIVVASCSPSNIEKRQEPASLDGAKQDTIIKTYGTDGKIAQASCLVDNAGEVSTITAPAKIALPISKGQNAPDIVVTCTYENIERSAILHSLPATRQGAVLRDGNSGRIAAPVQIDNGDVSSGVSSINQALALGLSTNVIPGDYYIYPKLVNIRF